MSKLGIEKGYRCAWGYGAKGHQKGTETVDLIPEKTIKYYQNRIPQWKGVDISKILPHEKIYFTKDALFPRHKLKEIVSNDVTRKIENADYIVINKEALSDSIERAYANNWYFDGTDWVEYQLNTTTGQKIGKFADNRWNKNLVQNFLAVEALENKRLILDEDLGRLIPREVEIKGDLYDKLKKMLCCNDKNSIKVGVEILSNLNYKEFEVETVILLNQSISNIRAHKLGNTVLFKTLIATVEKDYPDYSTGDYLGFILRLVEKSGNNLHTLNLVNDYFNSKHPTAKGSYRISIVEDEIGEKLRNNELAI